MKHPTFCLRSVLIAASISTVLASTAFAQGFVPGDPDTSFSGDGTFTFTTGTYSLTNIAIDVPRNRTYGLAQTTVGQPFSGPFRFTTAGEIDATWSGSQPQFLTFYTPTVATTVDGTGRVLLLKLLSNQMIVHRLRGTGSAAGDGAWGSNGQMPAAAASVTGVLPSSAHIQVDPVGRIVFGGTFAQTVSSPPQLRLFRLLDNGQYDLAFGVNGAMTFNGASGESLLRWRLDPFGRPVVVGIAQSASGLTAGAWRFDGNGAPDAGFGTGGKVAIQGFSNATATVAYPRATHLTFDEQAQLIVAGDYARSAPATPLNSIAALCLADNGARAVCNFNGSVDGVVANLAGNDLPELSDLATDPFARLAMMYSVHRAGGAATDRLGYLGITGPAGEQVTRQLDATRAALAFDALGRIYASSTNGVRRIHGLAPVEEIISNYYTEVLARKADSGGARFWTSQTAFARDALKIDPREALRLLATQFFRGTEYANRGRTNLEYVDDLFNTFYQREPTSTERNAFGSQLTTLNRDTVMIGFLFAPEFDSFMTSRLGATPVRPEVDLVTDLYRGFLRRLGDVDGFNFWLQGMRRAQCQGAAAVAQQTDFMVSFFTASPEYLAGAGTDTRQFVSDLYNGILRRGAEPGGFAFWVNEIDQGRRSRDDVRRFFANSPEFQGRVQNVVNAGCLP